MRYGEIAQETYMNGRNMEYERRKQLRQKKARRRRARRRLLFFCFLIVIVVLGGKKLWDTATDNLFATEKYADDAFIELHTPHKYEDTALLARLEELSKENKEYGELLKNKEAYPEALLAAVCNNVNMMDFVINYPEAEKKPTGGFTADEKKSQFPLLIQWDKRWGYAPYGGSCIAVTGCAPTCISMVSLMLTGNDELTPDKAAEFAQNNGYYMENTGTSWGFLSEGAAELGLRASEIPLSKNKVMDCLKAGMPIICSMREGSFTTAGHFIVLAGEKEGKIIVRDPNSRERSETLWTYDDIEGQIKNLWAYEKI